MSRYTGRYDLGDLCGDDINYAIANYEIYGHNHIVPLNIKSEHDLIPYYPYGIAMMTNNKVWLSKESYIDSEERKVIQFKMDLAIRYYNRCRRKKTQFDLDECVKIIDFMGIDNQLATNIANRVAANGKNATIVDLHQPSFDRMRRDLYDDMIKVGWSEYDACIWCFGIRRGCYVLQELSDV